LKEERKKREGRAKREREGVDQGKHLNYQLGRERELKCVFVRMIENISISSSRQHF